MLLRPGKKPKGGTGTVSVATWLVALPDELVTTTLNALPESVVCTAGRVSTLEVAPERLVPFFNH